MKPFKSNGPNLPTSQIAVLDLVQRTGRLTYADVVEELGVTRQRARNLLCDMHNAGRVRRVSRGVYGPAQ